VPTALELTREGWKPYLEAASRRGEPSPLTLEERQARERLLTRIRTAAAMLKDRFDARRVVLFGSLAHAAWFMPDSDVDLAVEGLASRDYVAGVAGWLRKSLASRPVDLIEIETVGESLRQAIERHGVEL